jgi:transcriptional regulator with XRE-family HTH domain
VSGEPDRDADEVTGQALVARELRRHRVGAGLSLGELARRVGYSRTYLSASEKPGAGLISANVVARIDQELAAGGVLIALQARADADRRALRALTDAHVEDQGSANLAGAAPAPSSAVSVLGPVHALTALADSYQSVIDGHELGGPDRVGQQREAPASRLAPDPVVALVAGVSLSDTSDETIGEIGEAVVSLAESHTAAPPRLLLDQVVLVHERIRAMLDGRLRLRQQRELYRILSDLLAHACLLLGDLDRPYAAERWGRAGLAYAREAQCRDALARTALAKTLRWGGRYVESADMARRGFGTSPLAPVRVQLASQEANAAALLGHADRARDALGRAREAAAEIPADSGVSAWSFPVARLALFAQSVARHTGNPDGALVAAAEADGHWRDGHPRVAATWAQIRIGAAIAHTQQNALDAAVQEAETVLDALLPEQGVSTVTAYVDELARALARSRSATAAPAVKLAERCRAFTAAALPERG